MTNDALRERIEEYCASVEGPLSGTALVEAAMHLEDTFAISITDDEMNTDNLGSRDAMVRFVQSKLGPTPL